MRGENEQHKGEYIIFCRRTKLCYATSASTQSSRKPTPPSYPGRVLDHKSAPRHLSPDRPYPTGAWFDFCRGFHDRLPTAPPIIDRIFFAYYCATSIENRSYIQILVRWVWIMVVRLLATGAGGIRPLQSMAETSRLWPRNVDCLGFLEIVITTDQNIWLVHLLW